MTSPRTLPEALAEFCEDRRRALGLAVVILILFLSAVLAGCDTVPFIPNHQGQSQANFVVLWRNPLEIVAMCGKPTSLACTINKQLIVTRMPKDWNDDAAICALGHETAHVLGAIHD